MLSANSEREKITITIKKANRDILENLAERDNRNLSRQVDFLIEQYCAQAEAKLVGMLDNSVDRLDKGERSMSASELLSKLKQ